MDDAAVTARLVESEARYRAFIENASDMIQSVRPDGTFEFVNRAWHRTFGYGPEDLARLTIWDVIHPDSRPHCQELFARVMQGHTLTHVEAVFVARDGRAVTVEGDATPRLVDGAIVATHSFFRDMTERLRARALEERNAQLERERRARYLEKMAALGKLAAGLSHELNNPASAAQRAADTLAIALAHRDAAMRSLVAAGLAPEAWAALEALARHSTHWRDSDHDPVEISEMEDALTDWLGARGVARAWELSPRLVRAGLDQGALERAIGDLSPASLAQAAVWTCESLSVSDQTELIARSVQRISALVGAVRSYSHMDRATEQQVNVHDGLEDTLIILGHRLKEMQVVRNYDRTLPLVRVFGSSLNQVWTNVIDNAVDATGGRGAIEIRTSRDGDRVVVELSDNGAGIPPEHLTRIFEPFFSTKGQGEGLGLGLDTVWRIVVEEHGGTIDVQSAPGRTTFTVTLPIAH